MYTTSAWSLHIFCFYVYNKHMKPAHFLFLCIQQAHEACTFSVSMYTTSTWGLHIFCFYVYNKHMRPAHFLFLCIQQAHEACTFSVSMYTTSTWGLHIFCFYVYNKHMRPAGGSVCTFSIVMPTIRCGSPLSVNTPVSLVGQGYSNRRVERAAAGAPRHQWAAGACQQGPPRLLPGEHLPTPWVLPPGHHPCPQREQRY